MIRNLQRFITMAALTCCTTATALANPTGAQVVNGNVSMSNPAANILEIVNTPGSIVNWQDFSIAQGEITRFIQQNGASAILNRVVGGNPSDILGQLMSNGQVWLINPNGIVFGAGAVIDTNGFVASTLDMANQDFLDKNLVFSGDSGEIHNAGNIRSGGGDVVLISPVVENTGSIETNGADIILAAGHRVMLTSLHSGAMSFEVQAPGDRVVNLGSLISHGGAVGAYATSIRNAGTIQADRITRGADGTIRLEATDTLDVSGQITARGLNGQSGGRIELLGDHVTLETASIDASGASGGGTVLVGGDFQGNNPAIRNATTTHVKSTATINADAIEKGDGGEVIVWADDTTEFHGSISATGGRQGGDGGFAEVSGKKYLTITGHADLTADNGTSGLLLLDPGTVNINDDDENDMGPNVFNNTWLSTQLDGGSSVVIDTGDASGEFEPEDIIVEDPVNWDSPSRLTLFAGGSILINADIDGGSQGEIAMSADGNGNDDVDGSISTGPEATISGDFLAMQAHTISVDTDVNGVSARASGGSLTIVEANSLEIGFFNSWEMDGVRSTGDLSITAAGPITVGAQVRTDGGGDIFLIANPGNIDINIDDGNIRAGDGDEFGGNVNLTATSGSITNNSGSVEAEFGAVNLTAANDIGTSEDPISTNAETINANSTVAGDVYISEDNEVFLGGSTVASDFVASSGGTMYIIQINSAGGIELTAPSIQDNVDDLVLDLGHVGDLVLNSPDIGGSPFGDMTVIDPEGAVETAVIVPPDPGSPPPPPPAGGPPPPPPPPPGGPPPPPFVPNLNDEIVQLGDQVPDLDFPGGDPEGEGLQSLVCN